MVGVIELIRQRHARDCEIAAVAMVVGKPSALRTSLAAYAEVLWGLGGRTAAHEYVVTDLQLAGALDQGDRCL